MSQWQFALFVHNIPFVFVKKLFSLLIWMIGLMVAKGAVIFHLAGQSKGRVLLVKLGFGTSEYPIFMKLFPDHLWH